MATASYQDIQDRLPHQVKDIPTEDQMDKGLAEAVGKASKYDIPSGDLARAEANWACYYLLKTVIQVPETETDGPISNTLAEDPAAEYKRRFFDIATIPGPELV